MINDIVASIAASIAMLIASINLYCLVRSKKNLDSIREALKQQRKNLDALEKQFESLQTDEERIAFLRKFLSEWQEDAASE